MFGTGLPEIVIILLVVLVLFGPAVLTFWLGYMVGQNRAEGADSAPTDDEPDVADDGPEESRDE
jgi:Sec-independent protein translocase protein TatA